MKSLSISSFHKLSIFVQSKEQMFSLDDEKAPLPEDYENILEYSRHLPNLLQLGNLLVSRKLVPRSLLEKAREEALREAENVSWTLDEDLQLWLEDLADSIRYWLES
jgi:hypothetical protein